MSSVSTICIDYIIEIWYIGSYVEIIKWRIKNINNKKEKLGCSTY